MLHGRSSYETESLFQSQNDCSRNKNRLSLHTVPGHQYSDDARSHHQQLALRQKMSPPNSFASPSPDMPQLRKSLENIDKFASVVILYQDFLKKYFMFLQNAIRRRNKCRPDQNLLARRPCWKGLKSVFKMFQSTNGLASGSFGLI